MKLTNMEAIQAQGALALLGAREDIPIKASLDIALISNQIDVQVKAYQVVLTNIYKKYSVEVKPSETETRFVCSAEGEDEEATAKLRSENLQAFMEKFSELLEANTADMTFNKIRLPSDITMKPEILKALVGFIEIEGIEK